MVNGGKGNGKEHLEKHLEREWRIFIYFLNTELFVFIFYFFWFWYFIFFVLLFF